jgi:O-antigen/teichoic acid export membrane protein
VVQLQGLPVYQPFRRMSDPGSKPSRTRNYLMGLGSGYVATAVTVVVGLWLTPFTLRFLDREQFAIFTLAFDVLSWLTLLDFGISSALRVQAAQLSGRPDTEKLNRLASTAFFAEIGVMAAVVLCGVVLALLFPQFFPIRPDLQRDATRFVLLLLIGTALSLGTQTFSALLVAHQQIHVDNALSLLNIAIRTVLTVLLLKAGWGLYSLGVANLAARVTTAILGVFRTFRLLPALRLRWSLVSWDVLKGTGSIGLWFTLGSLANILILSLDRVVTGKLISVEMVTTLTLSGRLFTFGGGLLDPLTNTARPMLAQLVGQQKLEAAATVYHQLFTLSTGLAIVGAASIWAGNGVFVNRWVGARNYGGWLLDLALALRLIVNSWVLPNRAILTANLVVKQPVLIRLVEAGVSLALVALLAAKFGVPGIVFGFALGGFLTSVWYFPYLTARVLRRSLWDFARHDVLRMFVAGAVVVPLAFLSRELGQRLGGYPGAVLAMATCGSLGCVMLWIGVLDAQLRGQLRQRVLKSLRLES